MADVTINSLADVGTLDGSEEFEVEKSSASGKTTASAIQDFIEGANNTFTGSNTFSQLATFSDGLTARNDGTGQAIVTYNSDLGALDRSAEFYSPDSDSASAPFYWGTSNSFAWEIDSNQVLLLNSSGETIIKPAGTEVARFTSSGLSFDGGTNSLNDYEVGSYTPVLQGLSTTGTNSYSRQQGRYIRIGAQCIARVRITLDGSGGALNSTGDLVFTLPFTVDGANPGLYPCMVLGISGITPSSGDVTGRVASSGDYVSLLEQSGGTVGTIVDTECTDSLDFIATVSFEIG